ncbi:MAG TPA: fumarylacetoacetate hydrolase family protein [Caldimonas sp.]|jgi:2-keto-4-pentenoate hydratase|nr:fumarylacetoacetate hydrolase family protein [Caldimonas sp.]HEX2540354.1 fumarylacetoacetate hydrolase family protein [Caldimonas sp.]
MPQTTLEESTRSHAAALREAQKTRRAIAPIRDVLAGAEQAYAVQTANIDRALASGSRVVGRKIGLTSKAVQVQLGVDQPDYGALLDTMALYDGEEIASGLLIQPKVEAEVAFVLGRDLRGERLTPAEVVRAIEFALPAIEIVDSRIQDWNIKFLDTVADNASSALFVVGNDPRSLRKLDLRSVAMTMNKQGEEVSSGSGAACLGHPINAVVWLARKMVESGSHLREGDLVMSGALGPMVKALPGDAFEAHITTLGSVRVEFAT